MEVFTGAGVGIDTLFGRSDDDTGAAPRPLEPVAMSAALMALMPTRQMKSSAGSHQLLRYCVRILLTISHRTLITRLYGLFDAGQLFLGIASENDSVQMGA